MRRTCCIVCLQTVIHAWHQCTHAHARAHTHSRTTCTCMVYCSIQFQQSLTVCVCVCGRVLTCILMQGLWTLSGNSVVINQGLQESKLLLMKLFNSSPVCRTHTSCRRKRHFSVCCDFFPTPFPYTVQYSKVHKLFVVKFCHTKTSYTLFFCWNNLRNIAWTQRTTNGKMQTYVDSALFEPLF